jgi:GT2 family glycosyltransferase
VIAFVLPTRDRPELLARTLACLGALEPSRLVGAQVIVVDNASSPRVSVPERLENGLAARVVRLERNLGAAARNHGVRAAVEANPDCRWIVMLDDDSHPLDTRFVEALDEAGDDVGAVQAEITLRPREDEIESGGAARRREAGGLPEVFVGCGVAVRAELFNRLGGYDHRFNYYAEEYDLCARLLLSGSRVAFDRRFRVLHEKSAQGRDFNRIIARLVRNNAWIAQRYAPDHALAGERRSTLARYWSIARKERARRGYLVGLAQLGATLWRQPRMPMPDALWDRFTGLAAAREALQTEHARVPLGRVALVHEGKNAWCVRLALRELGIDVLEGAAAQADDADTLVVATMSPGPMLDALEATRAQHPHARVVAPWLCAATPATTTSAATSPTDLSREHAAA